MPPGEDREMTEAATIHEAVDAMLSSLVEPDADIEAVLDNAVEPEVLQNNATAAVSRPEAGVVSDTAPSPSPITDGVVVPSIAADAETAANNATATVPNSTAKAEPDTGIAAVPYDAPAAEAAPIPMELEEQEDEMMADDAAVAQVVVASNAAAAVVSNTAELEAGTADMILPDGDVGAVAGGGGGAQGVDDEEEDDAVGDAAGGVLGGGAEPLTSASIANNTTATTSTSWLGFLSKAKRAIVAATLPGGGSTTTKDESEGARVSPEGKQRLGAGWRAYPGAVLYRRDVSVVEEPGVPLGKKNRRALRSMYN